MILKFGIESIDTIDNNGKTGFRLKIVSVF